MKQGKGIREQIGDSPVNYTEHNSLTMDDFRTALNMLTKSAEGIKEPKAMIGAALILGCNDDQFKSLCGAPGIDIYGNEKQYQEIHDRMKKLGMVNEPK
jgi:hypothetical protein